MKNVPIKLAGKTAITHTIIKEFTRLKEICSTVGERQYFLHKHPKYTYNDNCWQ